MKSNKQLYIEAIQRVDMFLNTGGNPNHDKLGRFSSGTGGKTPKNMIATYHYSDKKLDKLKDSPTGIWLTNNKYGYQRRQFAKYQNKIYMPKNLNIASEKQAIIFGLYTPNQAEFIQKLKDSGFDGAKKNVDGDTHYIIANVKKLILL